MELKHTPGPWQVGTPGPNGCYTVGTTAGLMTAMVAHSINMAGQREQAEGDARLIAAAPELLEALRAVIRSDAENRGESGLSVAVCQQAISAIAKATAQ